MTGMRIGDDDRGKLSFLKTFKERVYEFKQ